HRGTRRIDGARLLSAQPPALHDVLSYQVPRIRLGAAVHPAELVFRASAAFPQLRRRHDGGDCIVDERAAPEGLHAAPAMDARRGYRSVPAAPCTPLRLGSSGVRLYRPRVEGEEYRGLPV